MEKSGLVHPKFKTDSSNQLMLWHLLEPSSRTLSAADVTESGGQKGSGVMFEWVKLKNKQDQSDGEKKQKFWCDLK